MTYFEQKILTAEPIELVRIVYQRAIACVQEAREHLRGRRIEERCLAITRAYAAVAELNSSLRIEAAPELATRLQELYLYIQRRLLEANLHQSDAPLAEVQKLLTTLNEAWSAIPVHPPERQFAPRVQTARVAGPWLVPEPEEDLPVYALTA